MPYKHLKICEKEKKMTNVVTLNLNSIKQLIDLNGDKVNFELDFQVESTNATPFDALVVTQEMLDSETPLDYQKANGIISGKIVADKNIYQNYFLILKSDTPVECRVMTNVRDIQPNIPQQPPQQPPPQMRQPPQINQRNNDDDSYLRERHIKHKKSWFTLRNLCLEIIGLVVLFLIWYFAFYKVSETNLVETKIQDTVTPQPIPLFNGDELSDKISSRISNELSHKFSDEIKGGINSKMAELNEGLSNKVDYLDGKLNDNLNRKVDSLSNKIEDNLNTKVNVLSNKIEDNLSAQVHGLGTSISENIKAKVDGMSSEITENVNGKLSNDISELKEGLTENLTSNITSNIGEIKSQLEKIKGQSKTDSSLKSESVLKKIKDFKL